MQLARQAAARHTDIAAEPRRRVAARRLRYAAVTAAAGAMLAVVAAPASAGPSPWKPLGPDLSDTVLYTTDHGGGATWAIGLETPSARPLGPLAMRWTAEGWQRVPGLPEQGRLDDVEVLAPDDVWVAGSEDVDGSTTGLLAHWTGAGWTQEQLPLPEDASYGAFSTVHAAPDGSLWAQSIYAVGEEGVSSTFRRTPDGVWGIVPGGEALGWVEEFAFTANTVYATSNDGIQRYDGSAWHRVDTPPDLDGALYDDIDSRGPNDVWAVGHKRDEELWRRPVVVHFDGTTWREVPTPAETGQLFGIAFDADRRPVIVGETQNPEIDPTGSYVLRLAANGTLVRTATPPGAGFLHGADTDARGRVWVAGTATATGPANVSYTARLR